MSISIVRLWLRPLPGWPDESPTSSLGFWTASIETGDVHGREHVARQHTASGLSQDHNPLA
jgi:hypothetical protein